MPASLSPERARWVEQHEPQVRTLARLLAAQLNMVPYEDLVSAGYEGLVGAALRYDPSTGTPFGAFAHYRVRGAMIDAARRAQPAMRRAARAVRALQATQALLEHAEQRLVHRDSADPRSLRERVKVAAEVVAQATTAVLLSKLAPVDPDRIASDDDEIEEVLTRSEALAPLRRALAECDEDDRRLIEALYVNGTTMHEYAAQLGKSVSTVSRRHARVLARLSAAVTSAAPSPLALQTSDETIAAPRDDARSGLGPRGPPGAPDS